MVHFKCVGPLILRFVHDARSEGSAVSRFDIEFCDTFKLGCQGSVVAGVADTYIKVSCGGTSPSGFKSDLALVLVFS